MKKFSFLIILALGCAVMAQAQPINRATPESMKRAAEEAEQTNNPYYALEQYEKIYEESKDKAVMVKIAQLNMELRDYADAERQFGRLVLRDRKQEYTELLFTYAMCLKHNGKYAESVDFFNQYIAVGKDANLVAAAKREIEGSEMARKAKQADNLLVNNAGKKVNKPQTESSPVFSDGNLYYTSMDAKEIITADDKGGEDWYSKVVVASKGANNEYGEPTVLGTQINREGYHQGNVSISPDGGTMYFTRVLLTNNVVTESKIFYAFKGNDGWGAANEVVGVNGDYIAKHPAEGELFGEKVLFFVSNMPGGKGGFDIYYASKKSDGVFGLPVRLPDGVINTTYDEVSPFYKDGKLYFSSAGRAGFGGLDVYETQWNGSIWSEPRNMGAGINSSVDDQYYTQSADGYSGFLVSNRPGPNNLKSKTCCDDIYFWELERVKVNLNAQVFRLKRKNEKTNPPLVGSTVQVIDVSDPDPKRVEEKTNPNGSEFAFELQPEKSYMVIANNEGYRADTVKFNTVGVKKTITVDKKLTLRLLRKEPDSIVVTTNEPIRLNSIYYDFDDDKILPESEDDLQFLVDIMNRYKDMKIELSSHTDARGRDEYNETLSQRRAESAKVWMVAKGISGDRIVAKGYGEKQLLNQCKNGVECTEDEHRFNRRTEFKIISGPTSITIERKEKRQ